MLLPGPPNRAFVRYLSKILEVVEQNLVLVERQNSPHGLAHDTDLAQISHQEWVPLSIRQYAGDLNGYSLWWRSCSEQPYATGSIRLFSIQEMYKPNWKGIFYRDPMPNDLYDVMLKFKPIDFFVDEACVGLFHSEQINPELYFYNFEDEPQALGLDINGYLHLLTMSLGFSYWQHLLVELAKPDSPRPYQIKPDVNTRKSVLDFINTMPLLVPAWTLDKFVALYDQVRIV